MTYLQSLISTEDETRMLTSSSEILISESTGDHDVYTSTLYGDEDALSHLQCLKKKKKSVFIDLVQEVKNIPECEKFALF